MDDLILQVNHLSKSFGTHEVLKDIDFTVKKGDVTSIIGASGSGKSTLLRCINLRTLELNEVYQLITANKRLITLTQAIRENAYCIF